MHENSRLLFNAYARSRFAAHFNVLGNWAGRRPIHIFKATLTGVPLSWTGLDLATRPGVDIVATSEYEFPIADETYDVVFSANVIEHALRKPWVWM